MPTFAATSSSHDPEITVAGRKFVGTGHVFRMETVRIEAFSGMDAKLYGRPGAARVVEPGLYLPEVRRRRLQPQVQRDARRTAGRTDRCCGYPCADGLVRA
ncbi:hypothetical protein ABT034_15790 [Streptomyces sp. NPDC002773]|uniref:hypothetical protein n=1 Tax=Streptomyces sp. NPDC002773 TaxID=3154430 RepID=UPI00332C0B9F